MTRFTIIAAGCLVAASTLLLQAAEEVPLKLTEEQKKELSAVKRWRLVLTEDYGEAKKYKGLPIREDCKRLLRYGGYEVVLDDSQSYDATVTVGVASVPRHSTYMGGSVLYAGADIAIDVGMTADDISISFRKSENSKSCPWMLGWSNNTYGDEPEDAPFKEVYYECGDFFALFLSVLYQAKGEQPVLNALKDDSPFLKHAIAFSETLADFAQAGSILVEHLDHTDNDIREIAAKTLGNVRFAGAVGPLCRTLVTDGDASVRVVAAVALGKTGDAEAFPALQKGLEDYSSVRKASAEALTALKWQPKSLRARVLFAFANEQSTNVTAMGQEAVPLLIELLDHKTQDIRLDAIQVLAELQAKDGVGPLCRIVVSDSDTTMRKASAEALGAIGDKSAQGALGKAIGDKDEQVRKAAAAALGQIKSPEAESLLSARLPEEKDLAVRETIFCVLKKMGWEPPNTLPAKLRFEYLSTKVTPGKLRASLRRESVAQLIDLLQSDKPNMKEACADVLMEKTAIYDLGADYEKWKKWHSEHQKEREPAQ